MTNKRTVDLVFTNHSLQRMSERNFTREGVEMIVNNGEEKLLSGGCKRYTLTDNVSDELWENIVYRYFREKQVILSSDNVIKTVINNDDNMPDFYTYCRYVEV